MTRSPEFDSWNELWVGDVFLATFDQPHEAQNAWAISSFLEFRTGESEGEPGLLVNLRQDLRGLPEAWTMCLVLGLATAPFRDTQWERGTFIKPVFPMPRKRNCAPSSLVLAPFRNARQVQAMPLRQPVAVGSCWSVQSRIAPSMLMNNR